jgi:hypothetical protein
MLARITLKAGWLTGPLSQDVILTPVLVIGAKLVETSNEAWSDLCIQTASGQVKTLLAVERLLDQELASCSSITCHNKDALNNFAIVAGLWEQIKLKLVPGLLLPDSVIEDLGKKFDDDLVVKGKSCSANDFSDVARGSTGLV